MEKKIFESSGIKLYRGSFEQVIGDVKADLIFTSPPYNIGSKSEKVITNRKFGGFDRKSFKGIREYSDSMSEESYQQWQKDFMIWCSEHLNTQGSLVYNHKNRHVSGRLISPYEWFPRKELTLNQEIIWDRCSTHNHTKRYVYDHNEFLYVFSLPNENPYFVNQDFFWKPSKNKGVGSVWSIPREYSNKHNAPFPLKLARQVIRMWCPPGGLVCDPFSGSGTTMLACLLEGRKFIGSELLENYFNMAVTRFKDYLNVASGPSCVPASFQVSL